MASANNDTDYEQIVKEVCDCKWIIDAKDLNEESVQSSPIFGIESEERFNFLFINGAVSVEKPDPCLNYEIKSLYLFSMNIVDKLLCNYKLTIHVDEQNVHSSEDYIILAENQSPIKLSAVINKYHDHFQNMTIQCELTLFRGNLMSIFNSQTIPVPNFDWIHLDEKFDVVLRTAGGKVIPAHRARLDAASPVLKDAMSNVEQNQSVVMMDISYEAAVEMLRYIYTGSVETQKMSLIVELVTAADKYELDELVKKFEPELGSNLTIKNAVSMFDMALRYKMDSLKARSAAFINSHMGVPTD